MLSNSRRVHNLPLVPYLYDNRGLYETLNCYLKGCVRHQKYLVNIAHWWAVFTKSLFGFVDWGFCLRVEDITLQWETHCSLVLLNIPILWERASLFRLDQGTRCNSQLLSRIKKTFVWKSFMSAETKVFKCFLCLLCDLKKTHYQNY